MRMAQATLGIRADYRDHCIEASPARFMYHLKRARLRPLLPRIGPSPRLLPMSHPSALSELLTQPLPDLTLTGPGGAPFALRSFVGRSPFVLFVYIRNGTPG